MFNASVSHWSRSHCFDTVLDFCFDLIMKVMQMVVGSQRLHLLEDFILEIVFFRQTTVFLRVVPFQRLFVFVGVGKCCQRVVCAYRTANV